MPDGVTNMDINNILGAITDMRGEINGRLSTLEGKIDTIQTGHTELDKAAAVMSMRVDQLEKSAERQGERIGALEKIATTQEGAQTQKEKSGSKASTMSTIVIGILGVLVALVGAVAIFK